MTELYDFQREGVATLVKRRRALLCDDMGLGKTRQAVECIKIWNSRTLVFAKKNDLLTWEEEITSNSDLKVLIYDGPPKKREQLREKWNSKEYNVLLTHYSYVKEVQQEVSTVFPTIVADEFHLYGLLNRKSMTFKLFKQFRSINLLLLTGTPVRRDPSDLWGPIHLIDPRNYRSFWKFVDQYCIVEEDWLGYKTILPKAKNPKALQFLLYSKFMVRRKKEEIKDQLPTSKIRRIITVEMNNEQRKIYEQLDRDMIAELESAETVDELNYIMVKNGAEKALRLRQMLISPRTLGGRTYGGALDNLIDTLRIDGDEESDYAALILTPFRAGVEVIVQAIEKKVPWIERHVVMGGMKQGESHATIKKFQTSDHPRVLVCTIKSATGFTATAAKVGYFVGAEWSAIDNMQAEDRIYRIGQNEDVILNYFVHRNTVEANVLRVVGQKMLAEKSALGK